MTPDRQGESWLPAKDEGLWGGGVSGLEEPMELKITASRGDKKSGEGDMDPRPHPTESLGSWKRQETDRWACWEGFLTGRQRARATDEPHGSTERLEPDMSIPLEDLGGFGGLRGQRETATGGSALVLGTGVEEIL